MGSRQKVIAFTYFKGRKDEEISRKYEAGIFGNLEAIGQYYSKESLSSSSEASEEEASEWSMRVYHNLEDDDLDLCHLACLNRNRGGRFRGRSSIQPLPPLLLCNVNRNPLFGNASVILPTLWRFLPMLDDQVEVALFRDLDSRASSREVAAVQEWLQSKHVFHVMRDHPGHDMPILAGMWGVKLSSPQMRKALQAVFYQMLHADSAYWRGQIISSRDQALLERYLWPWAKDITLQHDSYHCDLFAKSHPWPTRRQEWETNNYVGAPFALNTTLSTTCPVKCRPRTHPEWNLC
eukprot:09625.XXX_377775_379280_1 [CDS] Oithona nana genome sequencing.